MSTFFIVGKSYSSLRRRLTRHGYDYFTLADKRILKYPKEEENKRVVCDFSNTQDMLKTAGLAAKKQKIVGVLCMYEEYVIAAAQIAKSLGLPGLPVESAEACSDKYLMRQMFAQTPSDISPDFSIVKGYEDLIKF